MRTLSSVFTLVALSFTAAASAGDTFCLGGNCPTVDAAVRGALADVGLTDLDSFVIVPHDDGSTGILLASDDITGLGRVADLTGTRISYVRGLEPGFLEIPFSGGSTITIGGLASDPGGVAHTDHDMEPGVPDPCMVCECTEDGIECWQIC